MLLPAPLCPTAHGVTFNININIYRPVFGGVVFKPTPLNLMFVSFIFKSGKDISFLIIMGL